MAMSLGFGLKIGASRVLGDLTDAGQAVIDTASYHLLTTGLADGTPGTIAPVIDTGAVGSATNSGCTIASGVLTADGVADFVSIPNAAVDLTADCTIGFRVRPQTVDGGDRFLSIKDSPATTGLGLNIRETSAGNFQANLGDGAVAYLTNLVPETAFTLNVWHWLFVVVDVGGNLTLRVNDGGSAANATASGPLPSISPVDDLFLFRRSSSSNGLVNADMTDLIIWPSALSDSQMDDVAGVAR